MDDGDDEKLRISEINETFCNFYLLCLNHIFHALVSLNRFRYPDIVIFNELKALYFLKLKMVKEFHLVHFSWRDESNFFFFKSMNQSLRKTNQISSQTASFS